MLGVPTTRRFSSFAFASKNFGTRCSSTCCRISPPKFLRISEAGALPGRKPGNFALPWNVFVTLLVSSSTASAGMEISSSCLQPSTNANSIYLEEKKSKPSAYQNTESPPESQRRQKSAAECEQRVKHRQGEDRAVNSVEKTAVAGKKRATVFHSGSALNGRFRQI